MISLIFPNLKGNMSRLQKFIHKAGESSFRRWLLNFALARVIPFNRPHDLEVTEIRPGFAKVRLPYRKSNLNHLKGIHACALAALSEYTSGLAMLGKISEKDYRIILKKLSMEYHYQAKMDVFAEFVIDDHFLNKNIVEPLENNDSAFILLQVQVHDTEGNHISTATMEWQVKKWGRVTGN
jgi:hypothetical protein